MKNTVSALVLFFLLFSSVHALSVAEVETKVDKIQQNVPGNTPSAPSGYDQKGFVGEVLSGIFTNTGKIKSDFVNAFRDIIGITDNVPKWDGLAFQEGTIWDKGGNIGIGNPNPTKKLDVTGDINFTGDLYNNGTLFNGSVWLVNGTNVYRGSGRVGIGTNTPLQQLHTTGTARFDGGVQVDGLRAISSTNGSHTAVSGNYGYFEGRNTVNERGFYLGSGNGGDRVNFVLDKADRLYIGGGNVGIGVSNPQAPLHVSGNVMASSPTASNHLTTKSYVDGLVSNAPGKFVDGANVNDAVYNAGRVGIGTSSPLQQLHTTGTARFDGGVQIDGIPAVSASNSYHSSRNSNYGYFEGRNTANERGFYLGSGNGADRVNFVMDKADKLYIAGASVGIGVSNPQAPLHVSGNVMASTPTANNHLTTKKYVDDLVTAGVSWKAPVTTSATATYGVCNASKEGWTTYNKADNNVYHCNGSSWINMGSLAVIPDATTSSPGKIQIAGDITGTWNNIVLKNNVVDSANIINGSITNIDISNTAQIDGTKINANFGSQDIITTRNIIAGNPTQNNHLTTKSYVDNIVNNISASDILPTCAIGEILKHNGTKFVCARNNGTGSSSSGGGGNVTMYFFTTNGGGCSPSSFYATELTGYDQCIPNFNGDMRIGTHDVCLFSGDSTSTEDHGAHIDVKQGTWYIHKTRGRSNSVSVTCLDNIGTSSSSSSLPSCSAGEILKHNGTEFVCGADNTAGGATGITTTGGGNDYLFGGIYSRGSQRNCKLPNEITGSCSCPAGYTDSLFADSISGGEQYLNYCWKSGGTGGSGSPDTDWTESATAVYNTAKNIGIGTASPSEKLEISGNVKASAYLYSSDERLKKDIVTTQGLETISKLRGVDFNWKETGEGNTGFIAQEVEGVLPQLVHTDESTGLKSVQYGNMIAPLVEAIKEQQAQIEVLQNEIELLKK